MIHVVKVFVLRVECVTSVDKKGMCCTVTQTFLPIKMCFYALDYIYMYIAVFNALNDFV